MDNKDLYEYARSLCEQAQEEEGTLEVFWNRISEYPDIIKEFDYYREHNDFLCELKPGGITVACFLNGYRLRCRNKIFRDGTWLSGCQLD